jgi:hypothetical protein
MLFAEVTLLVDDAVIGMVRPGARITDLSVERMSALGDRYQPVDYNDGRRRRHLPSANQDSCAKGVDVCQPPREISVGARRNPV